MTDERIFQPTPARLAAARREGRVARSASLTTVAALLAGAVGLWWYGSHLFQTLGWFVRDQLATAGNLQSTAPRVLATRLSDSWWLAQLLLPLLLGVFTVAMLANIAQGGFVWAPQRTSPDVARLWNGSRLTAMFSGARIVDVLIELVKLSVCLGVAGWGLWRCREQLVIGQVDLAEGVLGVVRALFLVTLQVIGALGVISCLEYGLVWWRHRQSLRMTAEEWQAEMKERETAMNIQKTRRFASGSTADHRS